jgi:hypothetical protein
MVLSVGFEDEDTGLFAPQHFLNFLPLPQGQGEFRLIFIFTEILFRLIAVKEKHANQFISAPLCCALAFGRAEGSFF